MYFYLYRKSMAKYQIMHEMKRHAAIFAIQAKHSDFVVFFESRQVVLTYISESWKTTSGNCRLQLNAKCINIARTMRLP